VPQDNEPESPSVSEDIEAALQAEDYATVIAKVRLAMDADPNAAMADPVIRDWLGRRFRNIFISEAVDDEDAVKHSQAPFPLRLVDPRDTRERVAKRMIRHITDEEIQTSMPDAAIPVIRDTTIVFAPGLLTGLLPDLAFQAVWPGITRRFGVRVIASDSHPMRSAEANVADLENAIEQGIGFAGGQPDQLVTAQDDPKAPGDIILIGYSKGSPDILALLAQRPDLAPRIRAVIGWAGAVGGSYLANDIYQKLKALPMYNQIADLTTSAVGKQVFRLAPVAEIKAINRRVSEYDVLGALNSLTTTARDQFISDHGAAINELPIPQFYFTGSTSMFEVPYFQREGTFELDKYDQDNDMQLTQAQAALPSPDALRLAIFHANHWDLSYSPFPTARTMGSRHLKNEFARRPAMNAIVLFLAEIGVLR
jgi:hypothetical protein